MVHIALVEVSLVRAVILCAVVLLAGCESKDAQFERMYAVANMPERCKVSREAQDYFLHAGDAEKLEKWRTKGAYECVSSGMTR